MGETRRPLHGHELLCELLRQAEVAGKRPSVRERLSGPERLLLPNLSAGPPVSVPPRRVPIVRRHEIWLRRAIAVVIVGCALLLGANAVAMTVGILAAALVVARVPVKPRPATAALTRASKVERPALALAGGERRFDRRASERAPETVES